MTVQDDKRERDLTLLFNLTFDHEREGAGTDAHLELDGQVIPFELKSSTTGSVSTARDVGMEHLDRWSSKHWLIGFYTRGARRLRYCHYASPRLMSGWIDEKRSYIQPDYDLAKIAKGKLGLGDLYRICGKKAAYSYRDALSLHKRQYRKDRYLSLMDMEGGYSPERMLKFLQARLEYVCLRGSTINNPHIPKSYFKGWARIDSNHAETLRKLVRRELARSG